MRLVMGRMAVPALALALIAAPADAGQITTRMDTNTPVMTFTIPGKGMYGEGGYVGPNSVSLNGGPFVSGYCTDLFRSIGVDDQYAAGVQPLSTLPGGNLVARLFTADAALGGTTPTDGAAMQIAVWDVVESARAGLGPVDPLKVGTLTATDYSIGGVVDIASSAVNMIGVMDRVSALLNAAPSDTPANLTFFAAGPSYGQGFVTLAAVPEPSTLISAGLGLAGVLGMMLRRGLSRARSR